MSDDPFDSSPSEPSGIERVRQIMANLEDVQPAADLGQPSNITDLAEFRNRPRQARTPPQSGERKSRFFVASELSGKEVPPRDWLVPGLIPTGTVTLLSGDGGTGKSLVALQLAAACAMGAKWIGRGVASGRALFISAEDDEAELHRRLVDVVQAEEAELADLDQLTLRSLAGEEALLATLDARSGLLRPSDLFRELDGFLDDLRPVVLVLDTLADLFPGNENDRAQARQFVGLLRGLAMRHQCAVVLLSHPSLTGMQSGAGTSGSTGWRNSVRSQLYLHRVMQGEEEPNPDARVLETMKANYGPTGAEIALTWRDGVFVADEAETGLDRTAKRSKADRVFLMLLRQLADEGRAVNSNAGPNYAPSLFASHPQAEGVSKEAFRDAMNRLFASNAIRNAEVMRNRKPTTIIQEVSR